MKRLTRLPSITPPAPVATSSEACSEGRLAITVSTSSATAFGDALALAPSATSRSIAAFCVSKTVSLWPASIRGRAIGKTIFPRPMNPISIYYSSKRRLVRRSSQSEGGSNPAFFTATMRSWMLRFARNDDVATAGALGFIDLREHFARNPKTVDRGRHAGIDRDLHQDFADFVAAHAVGQGALEVSAQFMRPVQDRDHGDVEHAAGLLRQLLAAPHRTPAVFVEQVLERRVETVDVLQRVGDIGLAEHRFANPQSLVVQFLVHDVSRSFPWRFLGVCRVPLAGSAGNLRGRG